jgi:hypothetical protein
MMANDYSIAVLLPTRGRTDALGRSVKSLFNRALDLDTIQIIFGFDEDDTIGLAYFEKELQPWLDEKGVNYIAMHFERMHYTGLNNYYNAMAKETTADWYFVWNDDAIMESSGWNRKITEQTGNFKILKVHTHREHPYSIFPIIPADWFKLFEFFSRHQMIDAELSQIAYMLDLIHIIDIYVTHDRLDLTGNNNDETEQERVRYEGNPNNPLDFHNPAFGQRRLEDASRIAAYMKAKNIDTTWWENVIAGKQDPWIKMRENDINGQMVHAQVAK